MTKIIIVSPTGRVVWTNILARTKIALYEIIEPRPSPYRPCMLADHPIKAHFERIKIRL